jgi:hypothetical protein
MEGDCSDSLRLMLGAHSEQGVVTLRLEVRWQSSKVCDLLLYLTWALLAQRIVVKLQEQVNICWIQCPGVASAMHHSLTPCFQRCT